MSDPELVRRLALVYEEHLIELQHRMHPPSEAPKPSPGILLTPSPALSSRPGQGESPGELAEHGRRIASAMFESVEEEVNDDLRLHPEAFRDEAEAVRRIARRFTRVDPPDEMFLLAAAWTWRHGISPARKPRPDLP